MKKQLFNVLLCCLMVIPFGRLMADVVDEGQSTEGKDFWVTFMQADQHTSKEGPISYNGNKYNALELSVSISSREDCSVTISNPFTGYSQTESITAGQMKLVSLYKGIPVGEPARTAMGDTVCYAVNSEITDTCALHITSTANISLFATNYKRATFDATNVLPTASLLDKYVIQNYTPSDHENKSDDKSKSQGSHFAIIAVENNTVVDYCPSVPTKAISEAKRMYEYSQGVGMTDEQIALAQFRPGIDTLHTPVLQEGQVWYVWTGDQDGAEGDLSGTYVKARDEKKIAVFQGCPHTNIPYEKKERDHIYSQAMPVQYWGNSFALTASKSRKVDVVRVMALMDGTDVYINGNTVHTFDFANTDTKHYWEFEIGEKGQYAKDGSCMLTTNCPCAVHLFLASKNYDGVTNGDPAMLWVNPIEQQIDQVTFATYASSNGTTYHYVNVVTDQPELMTLGDSSITAYFQPISGDTTYQYAQIALGNTAMSHTLKSNGSKFIAHVYGFTNNESYGYSAGGATKPLTQSIYINGEEFSPDKENKLCGIDTVYFACKPDFVPDSIVWHFGDNAADVILRQDTSTVVPHYYKDGGEYDASCTIYRSSSSVCVGQSAKSVIPIKVIIGRYSFTIDDPDIPCPENGVQAPGRIPYTSTIDLTGDHVHIGFNDKAKAAGFDSTTIVIMPTYFQMDIPADAKVGVPYGITITIESSCGDTTATMFFSLPVGNDVIDQRYSNVLGILKNHPDLEGMTLSEFQWYRKSDSTAIEGQVASNLNMYDLPADMYKNDAFYVCYTINKGKADQRRSCACAKEFTTDTTQHQFDLNPDSLIISATYAYGGDKVFVNADWKGETDIECYAQWITTGGKIYQGLKFDIPDGGCTIPVPAENGLYLLRVRTDGKNRSFKFFIQH